MGACKALPMPWLVLVGYTATCDHLIAFDAASGIFFFIALGTINFLFPRNEALGSNGSLAHTTAEAFLVPLSGLVFHLLSTGSEDLAASIAT